MIESAPLRTPAWLCAGLVLEALLGGARAGRAAPAHRAGKTVWVIPPADRAEVLRLLVPASGALPGRYELRAARIRRRVIRAVYRVDARTPEVVLLLGHPSQSPREAVRTRRFAVWPEGAAIRDQSRALLRAVVGLVRAHEGRWRWRAIAAGPATPPRGRGGRTLQRTPGRAGRPGPMVASPAKRSARRREPTRRQQGLMLLALAVLLLGLPGARILARRRRAAASPPRAE